MPSNPLLGPRWNVLTFEATGGRTGWISTLEGPCPASAFAEQPRIFWTVRLHQETDIRLAAGPALKDLPGWVSIKVGDASPVGKRSSNDGTARWGTVILDNFVNSNKSGPASKFWVELYVSHELFERVRALLESGYVPQLSVLIPQEPLPNVEPIRYRDQYVGDGLMWDNIEHPVVPIDWCSFEYTLAEQSPGQAGANPTTANRPSTKRDVMEIMRSVEGAAEKIEQYGRRLIRLAWCGVALLIVIAASLLVT